MTRRVVITGMGGVTAFGENWQDVSTRLLACENAVRKMPEWQVCDELHTLLGAPVGDFTLPRHYTHKRIRTMSRVPQMSTRASELALGQAGLIGDLILASDETDIAYGSSTGNTGLVNEFATILTEKHTNNITGTTYVQMMPHATVVNTGLSFGPCGRVIPTSSVCTSDNQTIDYVWKTIRHDYQAVMVTDSAEELCPSEAMVFDTLFTTSRHNNAPKTTPSPLDENHDELVIGEGTGTLILKGLEHAKAHGVTIYGGIAGFATNYDAAHITQPQRETIQYCMKQSLRIAGLNAQDIGYISAHDTAVNRGDMTENLATAAIYGDSMPLSSLKNYFDHTLGACGALEAWMGLQIMREDWSAPTLNLNKPDLNYGALNYVIHEARKVNCEFLQGNDFAFSGINTSIIIKRWP